MIMGIDPGVKGGMALLCDDGAVMDTVDFTGLKEIELGAAFRRWKLSFSVNDCFIEKVGHIQGDGAGGSFTFGKVYGMLKGLAMGHGLTLHDVYPAIWQARMGCMTAGNKNVSKNRAILLFPAYHAKRKHGITHAIADALLIAEYGRKTLV